MRDRIGEQRRALPWVKVDKRYVFEAPTGRRRWQTCSTGGAN